VLAALLPAALDLVPWRLGTARGEPAESSSAIPDPKLKDRVEVKLGEAFEQVCTGGAGRYLIFHLKKAKKLAVFDVSQVKVVHQIDTPADDVLYAAGLDKLMVVAPTQRFLQRWDLRSGKREKTAPLPEGGPVLKALMGCSGRGPLLLFADKVLKQWDVEKMEPAAGDGSYLSGDPDHDFQARVSAEGKAVVLWHAGLSGVQYGLVRLKQPKNTIAKSPDGHSFNGHWALPNADASLVFRSGGGIYDGDMRILAAGTFKGQVLLPTEDPRFFLAVQEDTRETNRVSICTTVDRQAVFTVGGIEAMTSSGTGSNWGHFRGEPRIHYLPTANALVNLPETNGCVVVRPFDLIAALAQSGQDYLVVLSRPEPRVTAGTTFTYSMDVRSKAGGLRYTLESGPEGMTVSDAGVVRWKSPERLRGKPPRVIITIRSASGKECQHAFDLTVAESPQTPAPRPAPKPVGLRQMAEYRGI
jgi:hypothetical protein